MIANLPLFNDISSSLSVRDVDKRAVLRVSPAEDNKKHTVLSVTLFEESYQWPEKTYLYNVMTKKNILFLGINDIIQIVNKPRLSCLFRGRQIDVTTNLGYRGWMF